MEWYVSHGHTLCNRLETPGPISCVTSFHSFPQLSLSRFLSYHRICTRSNFENRSDGPGCIKQTMLDRFVSALIEQRRMEEANSFPLRNRESAPKTTSIPFPFHLSLSNGLNEHDHGMGMTFLEHYSSRQSDLSFFECHERMLALRSCLREKKGF